MFAIVLAYGIKTSVRIDANNLSVCVKIFIFDWIEILCFKIFVCDQRFYYQINKNDIKEFKGKKESKKKKKKSKKTQILSYLYFAVDKMPKIKIYNSVLEYGADFEEIKNRALFEGGVLAAVNTALGVLYNKLDASDLTVKNVCDETSFRGAYMEGVIKFSLVKIFFYLLRIISVKKRFQTA